MKRANAYRPRYERHVEVWSGERVDEACARALFLARAYFDRSDVKPFYGPARPFHAHDEWGDLVFDDDYQPVPTGETYRTRSRGLAFRFPLSSDTARLREWEYLHRFAHVGVR